VAVNCGWITVDDALSQGARASEVALAERLIGLLQQIWGLGGEGSGHRDGE